MIVVAVIALVAAIAIPGFLRARHNANESAAIAALRTLSTALESFRAAQLQPDYPFGLEQLSQADPPYVPASLTSGAPRQGYVYLYLRESAFQYTLRASLFGEATRGHPEIQ